MSQEGLVSVLMGIYNCENTLREAIESIVAQTYDRWELIMCDDASTDGTLAIAKEYADRYPDKIIVLCNDQRSYLAFSLNRCLEYANGEFVARMDGDDRSVPTRFEKQVAFLNEHRDVDIVGTAMQRFDDKERLGKVVRSPAWPDRFTPHKANVFQHATIMGRKTVFEALGGYTVLPRTVRGQDKDLWFRFLKAGYRGANMPDVLYEVRVDVDALRRITPHTRWIVFQTTIYGYALLDYPWHWYIRPFVELLKLLVPLRALVWYRNRQDRRANGE